MKMNKICLAVGVLLFGHMPLQAAQVSSTHDQLDELQALLSSSGKRLSSAEHSNKGAFKLLKEQNSSEHQYLTYQQFNHDLPVWNHQVVIKTGKKGEFIEGFGHVVTEFDNDLKSNKSFWEKSEEGALEAVFAHHKLLPERVIKSSVERIIYLDNNHMAHFAFKIEWMADVGNQSTSMVKKVSILDSDFAIIDELDALFRNFNDGGSGPGGNIKVGGRTYDKSAYDGSLPLRTFVVHVDNNTCFLNAMDVDTRDAKNELAPASSTFSYDCSDGKNENNQRTANNAYSPLNDAHYHGQVTQLMYQTYLNTKVLGDTKVIQNVHFGQDMDQAFYEDGQVYYGDGYQLFYPMVALDVVAHELSHGFTHEYGSGTEKLMLTGQARAINESFSDIAGEAAKFYLLGENDWKANYEAYKTPNAALRYMDEPTQDGQSIDHVEDWEDNVSAHHGGGVFNKAFHRLITQSVSETESNPWNPKYGFIVFANANRYCWTATSSYQEAASCVKSQLQSATTAMAADGVRKSDGSKWLTNELKNHLRKAFAQVGISLPANYGVESDFTPETRFLTVSFHNNTRLNGDEINSNTADWQWLWSFGDGNNSTSNAFNPSFEYSAEGEYPVSLKATAPDGSTDIFQLSVSTWADYCTISGGNEDRYYIQSVTMNGQTQDSGSSPYSDFSHKEIDVIDGGQFNVSIKAGLPDSSANNTKKFYIWLDKNGDGQFHKTEELAYFGSDKQSISTALSVSGDPGTKIRARVMVSFGLLSSACGQFTWGEAEDYTLKIADNSTPPTLDITAQVQSQQNQVTFNNQTLDGRISGWEWDFGDNSGTSNQTSPVYQYRQSGAYDVVAKALSADNRELARWENTVNFTTVTEAEFNPVVNGRQVVLTSGLSKMPAGTQVHWNFGDNNSATDPDVNHTYGSDGTYTITLTLTNPDNPQGVSIAKQVEVAEQGYLPQYDVTVVENQNGSFTATFNNSTVTPPDVHHSHNRWRNAELHWTFGDGDKSTSYTRNFGEDTQHHYTAEGTYTTKLEIEYKTSSGPWTSVTKIVPIEVKRNQPVEYCEASGLTTYEHIQSMTVAGVGPLSNGSAGGIVNANNPIVLQADTPINFEIVAGYSDGVAYAENYHIWIDLNGDGQFGDGDWRNNKAERVANELDQTVGDAGTGRVNSTFTIPSNLIPRDNLQTRMRVLQYYSASRVNSINPCSNYANDGGSGEIEDYIIELRK
ncbi:PKD domain-containing protein [Aestuariibacter sp. AA17]|uniref:PKD domain-containing protein n=1 Tax=Fluctibacter corallii TaxID=2984329 RepID=A0ABT3AAU3_9ALTE|nr:PKD domain-containing protein [Aestuariibacter sp. AA17]MCV2885692.1 PKD domain-containing protein [Aestuariibacter sp. AA17]